MRILRRHDYRRMMWKNGQGETTEIAVFPQSADLDSFDWRISMAPVNADGPFSMFAGIDRTLCILEGAGIRLAVEDRPVVELTAKSEPLPFPADVPTRADLINGAILDLNVMTRRGKHTHRVRRIAFTGAYSVRPEGAPFIVYCHQGEALLGDARLKAGDTAIEDSPRGTWSFEAKAPAVVYLIAIS